MKIVVRNFGENTSFLGAKGSEGLSAYEVAKRNGFVGTESEWVAKSSPYRIMGTVQAMFDMPFNERVEGMLVKVLETGDLYELKGGVENVNFVVSYNKFEQVQNLEDISDSNQPRLIRVDTDSSNDGESAWYLGINGVIEEIFTL